MFSLDQSISFSSFVNFSSDDCSRLSKVRIIQKHLVHCQGFPDEMANKDLLMSREFFGQYGTIQKMVVHTKEADENKKKINFWFNFMWHNGIMFNAWGNNVPHKNRKCVCRN